MIKLTFLSAAQPLTKTISPKETLPYPIVKNFSSHTRDIKSITEFHKELAEHASKGHCLLKGNLNQVLINEPRRDHHEKNQNSGWVCFDLDKAPFTSPDEFMNAIGLPDTSYVIQYSASYKLVKAKAKTLSAHIFAMLEQPISPKNIEAWLMHLNLDTPVLERSLSLTASLEYLHFPLDIAVARNSQIIYIAPPILKDIKPPLTDKERIQLIKKINDTIPSSKIVLKPVAGLKSSIKDKINALRVAINLKPQKSKVKIVNDMEIQPNAAEVDHYEIVHQDDEFTRLNIGANGDSNAYWFFTSDFEILRNFKNEPFTYLKDTLPDLYKQLSRNVRSSLTSTSTTGDVVLAIRDKASGQYWKGLFNDSRQHLELHTVDSKDKLHDFLQGHGVPPPPFISEWEVTFDPQLDFIVNEDRRIINRFYPTPLMKAGKPGKYPTIQKFIDHAVGTGEVQEHFLNWLAVIMQHRMKTKTAWILHGNEGTGKGVLVNKVLRGIFEQFVSVISSDDLNSEFNQWLEKSFIVFVDEIEVDMFEKKATEGKLRRMITDSPQPIRRMRTDTYDAPNFTNFIFASNKPQPVKIPITDRRFNVGQFQFKRLVSNHHEIEHVIPSEIPAFAHYLLTRKACIDTAAQVLKTEDREKIQRLSLTSVDELAHNIVTGNLEALLEAMPDENLPMEHTAGIYANLMRSIAIEGRERLSRDQLRIIFEHCVGKVPDGVNKFTSFLRHHGIHTKKLRVDGIAEYGIEIKWSKCNIDHLRPKVAKLRKVK